MPQRVVPLPRTMAWPGCRHAPGRDSTPETRDTLGRFALREPARRIELAATAARGRPSRRSAISRASEPCVTFVVAAVALALLARLVGTATEQLGSRLGSGGASVVQSALGNLPELFIALFALNDGLVEVVQAALVGSILANSVLVLGHRVHRRRHPQRPAALRLEPRADDLDADVAGCRDDGDSVARSRVPHSRPRRTARRSRSSAPSCCWRCSC